MIGLIVYDSAWSDPDAFEQWTNLRDYIEEEVPVQTEYREYSYRRVAWFQDAAEAVVFKLRWCERIRIEAYDELV